MVDFLPNLRGTIQNFFRLGDDTHKMQLKAQNGTLQLRNDDDTDFVQIDISQIKILGSNATNGIVLAAPNSMGSVLTFTLPAADGASGHVLSTNGAGTLSWTAVNADGDKTEYTSFDQTSGTVTALTPPANAIIKEIRVHVQTAAGGGSPTITLGISGQTDRYTTSGQVLLDTAANFIFPYYEDVGASPSNIIATVTPDSQTFSGVIGITYIG